MKRKPRLVRAVVWITGPVVAVPTLNTFMIYPTILPHFQVTRCILPWHHTARRGPMEIGYTEREKDNLRMMSAFYLSLSYPLFTNQLFPPQITTPLEPRPAPSPWTASSQRQVTTASPRTYSRRLPFIVIGDLLEPWHLLPHDKNSVRPRWRSSVSTPPATTTSLLPMTTDQPPAARTSLGTSNATTSNMPLSALRTLFPARYFFIQATAFYSHLACQTRSFVLQWRGTLSYSMTYSSLV